MRRWLVVALSVVAVLGLLAPVAEAQTPKVTINGLVDQVTSWSRNMSVTDANYNRTDSEWYARTRVRPDITAEVGTTKFVFGLEIDAAWGQVGAQDTNVCTGTACPSANPQRSGSTGGWDLNTDTIGQIEVKWAYTEFDIPFVPGARLRLGAQPWAATYKLATLANGDFAGAHMTWAITPAIRTNLTYAQIEENSSESESLFSQGLRGGARSEDFAFVASVEVTPFKGLDIRPIYSYARLDGTTSGATRAGRGGVSNAAPTSATLAFVTPGGTLTGVLPLAGFAPHDIENRHTIGVDARLRLGPFSLDPTIFYQFGKREVTVPAGSITFTPTVGAPTTRTIVAGQREQDISAWFFDVIAGFQAGPLLVEGRAVYTTGSKASDNLFFRGDEVNFYQPISTDTSYWAGWANIFALGIDYFNILYSGVGGLNPGAAIGYDKYGLIRFGARASYALTPTFTPYVNASASWTEEGVDVNSVLLPGAGLIPAGALSGNTDKESYLGFELNAGFTWRIAPNLAFDLVGGYLWAGKALGYLQQISTGGTPTAVSANPANTSPKNDVEDVKTIAARFRFTF